MRLIEWLNGITKLSKATMDEFQNNIQDAIAAAKLEAHPIGSYYWSSESTDPSTLFGGTWEQVKDKFILAVGDTYTTVGATGGSASVTLKENNLPRMTGTITMHSAAVATNIASVSGKFSAGITNASAYRDGGNQGSGAASVGRIDLALGSSSPTAIDNNPPYETAYCWKRTA